MFTVGQKVWVVGSHRHSRDPYWIEITRVGRKWATLANGHRFDKVDMVIDGHGCVSPGRVYLTQEEHEESNRKARAWHEVYRLVSHQYEAPRHLSTEKIEGILKDIRGQDTDKEES